MALGAESRATLLSPLPGTVTLAVTSLPKPLYANLKVRMMDLIPVGLVG